MISVKEIDQLIKHPQQISKSQLSDLNSLAEKYPYSQIFSILYLKGLKNNGDFHFDDELAKNSYRITDRVQLYNLIEDTEHIGTQVADTTSVESATDPIIEKTIDTKQEITENTEPVFDLDLDSQTLTPEITTDEADNLNSSEAEVKSDDAVDQNILHHALTASYQLDELSEAEEEKLTQRQSGNEIQEEAAKPKIEKEISSTESTHSFTSWLKANNNYEEGEEKDREHIKQIVTNFENFDPSDDLFGEIKKPKAEFFSPVKKAKESLDDSAIPVSETLAKIYALQGNYPKAIEAYEQLSLINPEKKIFFADLIKELKNKIHSK
jgi:tetratricopeptide (TPR) repeat protein